MKAGTRLSLYALGLIVAFVAAFGIARAVVPESMVADWESGRDAAGHDGGHGAGHDGAGQDVTGLSLGAGGYLLSPIEAPAVTGQDGRLSFQIRTEAGEPVTEFATVHQQDLHLIVVRSDGASFRHAHPQLDTATGTWSLPWRWDAGGTYRLYADFTPTGPDAPALTLSRLVEVRGDFDPVPTAPSRTVQAGAYTVTLDGDLAAAQTRGLTMTVTRDGAPVTGLEPYLGAFGHLVVLRAGDLAYLHVHSDEAEPAADARSGPELIFDVEAPTAGRYLLYLDFQVDGQVHTAAFVLDADTD
ncbi:hypothetical protein GOHSU_46_00090 [Gordonia hirsuta DSM 44140 = NBRC 16056]|uniref:Heavy metal-binding domain-containing protein n=1 Tax=Gordonia hirsuta DSM 44140 = NBRC 16056 TaxID=1121927 RepID=L7LF53_9ACTN|nr:hypothetical protein [Gordonia hirsuta]GAC58688.1 hypothetical protein GOHSU_46_00090 [Gordonia hirsuta DSM 44140 = NBRC 16056]